MLCDRCSQPIKPGQPHRTEIHESASAARPAVVVHKTCPTKPTRTKRTQS